MRSTMRLATKLIVAFGLLIALQVGGNVTALFLLGHINGNVTELATNWLPSVDSISDVDHQFQTYRRWELLHVMSTDDAGIQEYESKLVQAKQDLKTALTQYGQLISNDDERRIYQHLQDTLDNYWSVSEKVLNLSRKNLNAEAKKLTEGESRQIFNAALDDLARLVDINRKGAAASANNGNMAYKQGRIVLIGLLVGATLLGVAVCLIIIRGVSRQLGEDPGYLFEMASRIAAGEMDMRFKEHTGEGGVFAVLKQMVANLKQKIAEADKKTAEAAEEAQKARAATQAAEEARVQAENAKAEGMLQAADRLSSVVHIVSSASEQLSAQIEQSSQGADHQSRRLAETATAMEEMNATVLEVARNASEATDTSERAKNKAQEGAAIVGRVVAGIGQVQNQSLELKADMTTLGQQAEGIGHIMNVISDIADQTNLLALNAAIEAARAGEAGRGFAVVADEVRKLAEKTMTATKEVGDAIMQIQSGTRKNIDTVDRTVKNIEEATGLAQASGEALAEIVANVDQSTDQVRSIATASEEQSAASEEINRSVEEVNRIASETMDALRQSAQAVADLAQQAQELNAMVQEMQGGPAPGTAGSRAALPGARSRRALR
ncbi:methyl-accepting chemotaxis sensory transducer [Solidesulfovibrio carbinoliphilus subsp. oakridgensis]|uniref:Methyl-accepting chemotaxis sensory transducer n=1 Tax=Solidesulfovibrio carbinoliphilus subsp. oakridgensis TaxID=694327 RepID=G7QE45_9BACT|nr:methyl-accepting chemotaxis protein [Solidesulfovibrio carbinoliphilus]EHJ46701.1 methyl-accepting chemotaxis sensory transducer [Solidesulfovibrio carbinoliphilus subsp. oakridgensis]